MHARSLLVALLTAAAGAGCGGPAVVVSAVHGGEIRVDGRYEDWDGRFTRIDGKRSVGLGITDDRANLYVCLVTRDLGVQSLLRKGGFTLWLDPMGGRHEVLGVRVAPIEGEVEGAVTPRIEIVRDGAEYGYQLADPGPEGPVDVKTSRSADVVVYEFRITREGELAGSERDRAHLSLAPGRTLGVGVVTEPLALPETPRGAPRIAPIDPLESWVVTTLSRGHPPALPGESSGAN